MSREFWTRTKVVNTRLSATVLLFMLLVVVLIRTATITVSAIAIVRYYSFDTK